MTDWSPAFLSRLVHELRTPLASMRIAAEMLAEDPRVPASLGNTTAGLGRAVADLDDLLEEVGEINRIRSGRTQPSAKPLDAARLFAEVTRSTAGDVAGNGAVLTVNAELPGETSPPSTDATLLARALGCLVRSACAGGARRLELGCVAAPAAVFFELRDDGPPPEARDQERFFEPLSPHGRARRAHGGTGLGLPLAHAIAVLLGGDLSVRAEGGGTVLSLRLPRG